MNSEPQPSLTQRAGFVFLLAFLFSIAASGCTRSGGEEARAQFVRVVQAVKGGSLAAAYTATIPSKYDRDLNELLAKVQALITEAEFDLLRETLAKAGVKFAPVVGELAKGLPLLQHVAAKLVDCPRALGLDTYADFMGRDFEGLIGALDLGFFAEFAQRPGFRDRMKSVGVQVKESKGDWALLRFDWKDADGKGKDVVEVIRFGKKWVPSSWVVDWPAQMKDLKARLEELEELKKTDPLLITKQLRALASQLDDPAPLVEMLLKTLGAG